VTGSIAAYKAGELVSKMTQAGARVDVILTRAAEQFISPLTFASLSGRKAYTDSDLWGGESHILHLGLGHSADLLLIAPITANTMAKLAHGQANDLLSITALAARCPILVAPAMDVGMYENIATQENVKTLKERGIFFAGPARGRMASGLEGLGRMVEPAEIIGEARRVLGLKHGKLAGKKIIITAGGTREAIDPVRFISNRSSGKQGYALAQAGVEAGAEVTLISTPTALTPPIGVNVIWVQSAEEMLNAVLAETDPKGFNPLSVKPSGTKALESTKIDALIMASAVADFRPTQVADKKLKKRTGVPQITLEAAPDILKRLASSKLRASRPRIVVGFAAESRDLLSNAAEKIRSKKLDFIVANDISAKDAGFDVDKNRVTLLYPDGEKEEFSLRSKFGVAEIIIERVAKLLGETNARFGHL
ncbi:MAG TPA: bifunctional phosphopantothenoylcysteine decarboxylase/phosphopantothenate--cysteine ligase CoaBC, partial [Anaerolineales bacterium]|nr:bifunctional phosphopantothenoylcysteine decarboxylase/phosphopantothenate--cysteine ligase CoaBC [Anaerolineales bacterium]